MSAWAPLVAWLGQLDPGWCDWEPEDGAESVCDEDCDRNGGQHPCKCYGTVTETTEGGW